MSERKRVYLGMPGYGEMSAKAARGFFRSSAKHDVMLRANECSLLAHNFNILWCEALNIRKAKGLDYFAMQHADIEPEDGWLDKLVEELEAQNLDVLGVVAPIKDSRGMTSIAMGRDDGDTWKVHGRLTMSEVMRLPETFTSEDIGRPLLLNTGLWVCRLGEWSRKVCFTINDRISIDRQTGDFVPQVEPEDWYFSRLLHELQLKVGCTRKIKITHRGHAEYGNDRAWGQYTHDREYLSGSVLDKDLGDDWFPHRAAGWLSEGEGRELARLAEGRNVLEVGSFCGRSTVCLARTAKSVTAVDTFDGRGTATPGDTLPTFKANMARYGVTEVVNPIVGDSADVLPDLPPVYDLIFIDGSHDYESVSRDADMALRHCLKPGGLLAFHDYDSGRDEGVTAAVDELVSGGAEILSRVDSLAVVRPALVPLTPIGA